MSTPPVTIRRREIPSEIGLDKNLTPLLNRIYLARNITSNSELDYHLKHLPAPLLMKGMEDAVTLVAEALSTDQKILIVGDFDADGATSTTVMMKGLRAMGAKQVSYLIPNRFKFGYGLTPEIVEVAAQQNPDLIITVDNGIASIDGIVIAKEKGIRVLVTDHHLPGDELPDADVIINPNQPGDEFPGKNIAGVGVAFYLLLALRSRLRDNGWFTDQELAEPNLAELLDIVALGTVADVVPLDHCNRILVKQGLARINSGQACPGILALIDVANRLPGNLVASDLGFAIAPRLNAAGRIESMSIGVECLLAEEYETAHEIAVRLDSINQERRTIESEMKVQALNELKKIQMDETKDMPIGLCIYDQNWHQGVIGILAARIKERFHRPVIAFAPAGEEQDGLKGSARSIPGLHIRDVLAAVDTQHPGLIKKFGGHAMAAGLSLANESFEAFSVAFNKEVERLLGDMPLEKVFLTDGELTTTELDINTAILLRQAGPWGQLFPEPLFEGDFKVIDKRIVGKYHLKMQLSDGSTLIDAIMFNIREGDAAMARDTVHLVYKLDVNEFRGKRSVQMMVEHMQAC
ncbi:MAG TPA: single-stranded-DNA-specific exonuclease RecJ [Gammaproteobacteria bacterium]|nr:single-stranded-DNA-specific exonuclease RecJ [bacterium BMS3Abin11]GMT40966.1 MAG: single-stranded-DNA-specific exonuclease RecJ [bacterium]HDH15629.1 single-stranded-DNA-specific exonuclease RecJ [Gammaproteobacteria bacterium]